MQKSYHLAYLCTPSGLIFTFCTHFSCSLGCSEKCVWLFMLCKTYLSKIKRIKLYLLQGIEKKIQSGQTEPLGVLLYSKWFGLFVAKGHFSIKRKLYCICRISYNTYPFAFETFFTLPFTLLLQSLH